MYESRSKKKLIVDDPQYTPSFPDNTIDAKLPLELWEQANWKKGPIITDVHISNQNWIDYQTKSYKERKNNPNVRYYMAHPQSWRTWDKMDKATLTFKAETVINIPFDLCIRGLIPMSIMERYLNTPLKDLPSDLITLFKKKYSRPKVYLLTTQVYLF